MPIVLRIAAIQRYYPHVYHSPTYPTSDKIIPKNLFDLYWRSMRHTMALERVGLLPALITAQAVAQGQKSANKMIQDDYKEMHGHT